MLENSLYRIENFEKTESKITAKINLIPESEIFKGHFPENPVLPGVCFTHIVTELLSKGLESSYRLEEGKQLKFLGLVTPQTSPDLEYAISFSEADQKVSLTADVKSNDSVCFKLKAIYTKL